VTGGNAPLAIDLPDLDALFGALERRGYTLVGPTVRDRAIVLEELDSTAELPAGWTDVQEGGTYRLARREDDALFGHNAGPNSWKSFLFPSELRVWTARRTAEGSLDVAEDATPPPRYAFIGVRSCDLHAIAVQDRVFLEGGYVDTDYQRRREGAFIVAVNCGQAAATCFCVSMETGPKATSGFDLALTEVIEDGSHGFVVEVGSERGAEVLAEVAHRDAEPGELQAAERAIESAAAGQTRSIDTDGIKELLYRNRENPRWDEVADRCLTCGNCTMVCPTCFCHTVEDVTDLAGEEAERTRRWDSCFTLDHSYIHGGSVHGSPKARYRQWMTHKLATWIDQFGTSGCVGCGRCIAWCPVAIDITEEAAAIRATDLVAEAERTADADDR
jgi:sulfhydrogenase subunit beta (sulfur reductase)